MKLPDSLREALTGSSRGRTGCKSDLDEEGSAGISTNSISIEACI